MERKKESPIDLAQTRKKIQNYCARRECCSADVLRRLNALGLEPAQAQQLLAELQQERFIDDARYALAFVRDHIRFNHWGDKRIEQALRQQGISPEDIREALLQASKEGLCVDLVRLLAQRSASWRNEPPRQLRLKLFRFAISRGFAYNEVSEALETLAHLQSESDL